MWRPLLEGRARTMALEAIAGIVRETSQIARPETIDELTLTRGVAGVAVFSTYLARSGASHEAIELKQRYVDYAGAGIAEIPLNGSLWRGFAGIGWLAEYARDTEDDPGEAIDDALLEFVS